MARCTIWLIKVSQGAVAGELIVRLLLESGVEIDTTREAFKYSLKVAVRSGAIDTVTLVFSKYRGNIDTQFVEQLILIATSYSHQEIA